MDKMRRRDKKHLFRDLQQRLGLSSRQLSELLRISQRTIEMFRSGDRHVPESVLKYLGLILWLAENHPSIATEYINHKDIASQILSRKKLSRPINGVDYIIDHYGHRGASV